MKYPGTNFGRLCKGLKGMGQGGFPAAGETGEPNQGASVTVEAVAVGLMDVALVGEY